MKPRTFLVAAVLILSATPAFAAKAARVAETVPEPEPMIVHSSEPEPEPVFFDVDDLDTPAYLRQGKLLN